MYDADLMASFRQGKCLLSKKTALSICLGGSIPGGNDQNMQMSRRSRTLDITDIATASCCSKVNATPDIANREMALAAKASLLDWVETEIAGDRRSP